MNRVGIIGGGNMGAALIKGIAGEYNVCVCEKDQRRASFLRRRYGVATLPLAALVQKSRVIVLAVKPQDIEIAVAEVAPLLRHEQVMVSIAAGIKTSYIEKKLGSGTRVIRAMPNLPLQVGEGMTAICKGRHASTADVAAVVKIFERVGATVVVEENYMDAVTAVSGSGPAYVFLFAEAFVKAAKSLGLKGNLSQQLVQKTLAGSVFMMNKSKEEPALLRARVTSKGGTTQAALQVFMKSGFEKIFRAALQAAKQRSRELAKK